MAVPPEQASGAVHLHWNDITVETIDAVKTDVISMATKMVDEISAIPVEAVTFENTMQVSLGIWSSTQAVCVFVCIATCLSLFAPYVCMSFCLSHSICPSVCLSTFVSVCLLGIVFW